MTSLPVTGEFKTSAAELAYAEPHPYEVRGCASCGLAEAEHGIHLIHRFVSTRASVLAGLPGALPSGWPAVVGRTKGLPPGRLAIESYLCALQAGHDADRRLHDGLLHLPRLLLSCSHVSLSAIGLGPPEGGIASDDTARRCEDLQHLLDEGPILHVAGTGHSVLSNDLRTETRWPYWRYHVVTELGITAAMAFPLHHQARLVGALTFYSDSSGSLLDIDIALLYALTAPLTTVLVEVRLDRQRPVQAAVIGTGHCPAA